MKTAIVYHRVDWDGYTSAAVALRAFPDAELFGWTYNDPEPDMSSYDKVILVDLSLSEDWMLQNASKLIWCDHHKNTINRLMTNPVLTEVPGLRVDGMGACLLVWWYFFKDEYKPAHIRFVGTADVMDTSGAYAPLPAALTYGLYLDTFGKGYDETGDISKKHVREAERLMDDFDAFEGFAIGHTLEEKRAAHEAELFKTMRETVINGFKACILRIDERPNACIQNHLLAHTHDVFICIADEIENKYKISVRVPERSDFDASAFCRQYGGNGHVKAAGCLMTTKQILDLWNFDNVL